jgi:hypothetical protein
VERAAPGLTVRKTLSLTAMAVAVTFAGCGGDGDGREDASLTQDRAEALLGDFYELAQAKDDAKFCGDDRVYSADMCQNHWQWAGGPESVPSERPKVLGTQEDEDLLALRVCGTDGLGRPYQGDFVVERMENRIVLPLPVFWEGVNYSGTYEEGEEPTAGARENPTGRVGCP